MVILVAQIWIGGSSWKLILCLCAMKVDGNIRLTLGSFSPIRFGNQGTALPQDIRGSKYATVFSLSVQLLQSATMLAYPTYILQYCAIALRHSD